MAVRAQRKFAHKANYPALPSKTDVPPAAEQPLEQDTSVAAQPLLTNTHKPVNDLLDQVTFQNIHEHEEREPPLKHVRVLLERITPPRDIEEPNADLPPAEASTSKATENSTVDNDNLNRKRQDDSVQKLTLKKARVVETAVPEVIKGYREMKLRNRTICRPWTHAENAAHNMSQSSPGMPIFSSSRRASETSTEDKPLTYFITNRKRVAYDSQTNSIRIQHLHSSGPSNTKKKKRRKKIGKVKKSATGRKKKSANVANAKKKTRATQSEQCVRDKVEAPALQTQINIRRLLHSSLSNCGSEYREDDKSHVEVLLTEVRGGTYSSENTYSSRMDEQEAMTVEEDNYLSVFGGNLPIITSVRSCANDSLASTAGDRPQEVDCDIPDINPTDIPSEEVDCDIPDINPPDTPSEEVDRDIPDINPPVTSSEVDNDTTNISPPNTLADFIIRVFNWMENSTTTDSAVHRTQVGEERTIRGNDSGLGCGRYDTNIHPIDKVHLWLGTTNRNSTQSTEFKVPAPPPNRDSRPLIRPPPSSVSSSRSDIIAPFSSKELKLRGSCTAWNYKKLSRIATSPDLIKWFCAECTRCTVMFKLDKGANPSRADVYEFDSEGDDYPRVDISQYRTNQLTDTKNRIFVNISKQRNYMEQLKSIFTDKGKKVLQAAIIIKEKIREPLLTKEQSTLAEVIGILTACNRARINERIPTQPTQEIEPKPGPSRNRYIPYHQPTPSATQGFRRTNVLETPLTEGKLLQTCKLFPTEQEFLENPVSYALKIAEDHPGISICGIKPPPNFKPECLVNNTLTSFKVSSHYVHRMFTRWGPATRELTAIRSIQDPDIQKSPLFEGLEVDLVKLFHAVQDEDGFEACQNDKQKWKVVAEKMKLNVKCNSTGTKLENIYLKHLLSYNTLTCMERENAQLEVDNCWAVRYEKTKWRARNPFWHQENMRNGREETVREMKHMEKVCAEAEDCVTQERYFNYKTFKKIAQQVAELYFPNNEQPFPEEVEEEYWDIVMSSNAHVCVYAASVDATVHNCGFTDDITSDYFDHPWNLKNMLTNPENLLKYLGPSVGVTSTALQLGTLFATSCWHMDPTSTPWIEYLHSGSPKIWYSVSADQNAVLRAAAFRLSPWAVTKKEIWLACDVIMFSPKMLRQYGVNVERHVQYPGEFVIVYPNTYTACIDTGFSVSEGVYFAPHSWINRIDNVFLKLRTSCEPSLFSMEKLLISIAQDERTPYDLLQRVNTVLVSLLSSELSYRRRMTSRGIELISPEVFLEQNQRSSKASWQIQTNSECNYCHCHLHLSKVIGITKGQTSLCLMHGLHLFELAVARQVQLKNVFCVLLVSSSEIHDILETLKDRLARQAV